MNSQSSPPADEGPPAWVVVYLAPNLSLAEMLKGMLDNEGILVMLRSIGPPHLGASGPVEVLVPRGEVDDAMEVIGEAPSDT